MFTSYSESKIKPHLKMGIQRIQILVNKKSVAVKHQKREIAELLAAKKEEKARIKVEHNIRDDYLIEAYEILELLTELIHERIRQISNSKVCPADLNEAVVSVIWAASNIDIAEFGEVKKLLTSKFGSAFAKKAESNADNAVNKRLFQILTYTPPPEELVTGYLIEIAKGYEIEWTPKLKEPPRSGIASQTTPTPMSSTPLSIPPAPSSNVSPSPGLPNHTPLPPAAPNALYQAVQTLDPYERAELEQFRRNQQAQGQQYNSVVSAQLAPDDFQQSIFTTDVPFVTGVHAAVPYPDVYPHSFIPGSTHGCSFADSEEDQEITGTEEHQGHATADASSGFQENTLSSTTSVSFDTALSAPPPEIHINNQLDNKDAAPSTAPAMSAYDLLQARLAALNASNDS